MSAAAATDTRARAHARALEAWPDWPDRSCLGDPAEGQVDPVRCEPEALVFEVARRLGRADKER